MPRIRIKVCGIMSEADAALCVDYGVDAVGFIFAESPRRVDPLAAKRIIQRVPPFVSCVGVFQNQSVDEVMQTMNDVGLTCAQLHGAESFQYVQQLARPVIKVFQITDPNVLHQVRSFPAETVMLDVPKKQSASILDYVDMAHAATRECRLIISGKLTPGNVREAIMKIRPFAVDVASGVEESPGKKSEIKLNIFIQQVREAEYGLQSAG